MRRDHSFLLPKVRRIQLKAIHTRVLSLVLLDHLMSTFLFSLLACVICTGIHVVVYTYRGMQRSGEDIRWLPVTLCLNFETRSITESDVFIS